MRLTGKSMGKCLLSEAKWVTLTEFENMSGVHPTKKWRKNVKYKGQPIRDWLAKNQHDYSLNPFQDSQKPQDQINPQHTQLEQTPGKENENNDQLLMKSQDSSTQISTEDLPRVVRTMGEMLDRMFAKIEAHTQEVRDQETRHKNATKQLHKIIQEQSSNASKTEFLPPPNEISPSDMIEEAVPDTIDQDLVKWALLHQKNGKTVGPDGLPAEVIKNQVCCTVPFFKVSSLPV